MLLALLDKTVFPLILHKGTLQTVHDGNALLSILFLLQTPH